MKLSDTCILLLPFLVLACTSTQEPQGDVLARVGNKQITVQQALEELPPIRLSNDSLDALLRYRDDWIQRQLLLQEAERLNISQNEYVKQRIEKASNDIVVQALKDFVINEENDQLTVSVEEAQNYYQQNKEQFTLSEPYVQYRHLVTNSMAGAQQARQDLLNGVPWEDVVENYSIYKEQNIHESERFWPISMAGGDIGILNRYLNIIGIMEISPVTQVGNEFHFVQLTEERARGEHPDLEWLIEQIENWLELEKRRRFYSSYVKNLYLQAQANNEIEIYNVVQPETTNIDSTEIDIHNE